MFLLVQIAGLFNIKIRKTLRGRRRLFDRLQEQLTRIPGGARRLWLHISSMGEWEQGVPLIEALATRYPKDWFIVSLFSPSGYEHIKWRHERSVITYLPLDGFFQARKFITMVQPALHVIIRHDIWPNFQWLLNHRRIPSLLVNASISEERYPSVQRLRGLYRLIYNTFSAVCAVSELNKERLAELIRRPQDIYVCGDTRYDRVCQRALDTTKIEAILASQQFGGDCLVAGSTWPSDEEVILPPLLQMLRRPQFKLVLAPHEMHAEHLAMLERRFQQAGVSVMRLSAFEKAPAPCSVLLIDRIGLLANLYVLGRVAVVGGGFGPGVHNVLEPAAHGCVVCFGPRHLNSPEAKEMVVAGIGRSFSTSEEFAEILRFYDDRQAMRRMGDAVHSFVLKNVGAAERTADVAAKFLN